MPETHGSFIDVFGGERSGKSDFACSVAAVHGPAKYFALDHNWEGPVRRWRSLGAKISVETFFYSLPFPPPTSPKEVDFLKKANAVATSVRPSFNAFKTSLWKWMRDPKYPSLIIDNGSVLHRVCRLALWGYVHKVPMHLYAQRTNEMSTIYNELRYCGKHIVMIYREKPEYGPGKNSEPTGDTIRDAWDGGAYDSMLTLHADHDDDTKTFSVEVVDSTLSADHVGRRFSGSKRTYARVERRLLKEAV